MRVAISLTTIAAIFSFFYLFTNQQEDIVEEVAELTSPESIIQNVTTTTVPVIVEEPSTTVETTSFLQAYRANIQPRVYDLTEDVVFLCLLIANY